jgi:hypothetical protein
VRSNILPAERERCKYSNIVHNFDLGYLAHRDIVPILYQGRFRSKLIVACKDGPSKTALQSKWACLVCLDRQAFID